MSNQARGYIASGEFNGCRTPQHIQNQIVKLYCDQNDLVFVLSRAEYWMNGSTQCQLWAALKEGYSHIVFFSLWQLTKQRDERELIYKYCYKNNITLHFATERMKMDIDLDSIADIELLVQSHLLVSEQDYQKYINILHDAFDSRAS